MTTLAELVDLDPDPAFGVPTQIVSGAGVWRWVLELADPSAGSSVEWFDITGLCAGVEHTRGADEFAGRYRATVVELELVADDDRLAPWQPDTSPIFGTHVDLGAGLLIRGSLIRVDGGVTVEWLPRFTVRVETWRDDSYARGQIRVHNVTCRDLFTGLNGVPVSSTGPENWTERVAHVLTDAGWDFGHVIYGADQATGPVDVLELPARDEQSNALAELDATCDPAGIVWYTDRRGVLIFRPQVGDTFHADHFTGGATGTPWTDPATVTFSYIAEFDGGIAYDTENVPPFGIEDTETGIINHIRITDPGPGLYDIDEPVSVQRYGRHTRAESWQAPNNQVADDILARLAFATKQASPLDSHIDAVNFFPDAVELDWLSPTVAKHSTGTARLVVIAAGHTRQIVERVAPLGDASIDWTMTVTTDIATYDAAFDLLPVEDLTVTDLAYAFAEFGWTNPAQDITPTATWVRIPEVSALWIELSYPVTAFAWLGLHDGTPYTFEVRLIREVDGVITNVSPVTAAEFTTPEVPDPALEPDGDGGFVGTLPDVGDCDVAWTLEGFDGMVWVEIDSGTDPSGTVLEFDAAAVAGYYLYNLCAIEMCEGEPPGDEYCVTSAVAACITPPGYTNGDPPYDDADLIAFIPEVCPIDIVKEALSGDPGAHGPAWGGLTYVGADDIALKASAAGGVIAYGDTAALTYYGSASIGCRTAPQVGSNQELFAIAGMRINAVDGATGWYPSASVTTLLGETITVTDPTERSAVVALTAHATYDETTGVLELYVNGASVGTDTADDPAPRAAQGSFWRISAPANGWVTDCGVWSSPVSLTPPFGGTVLFEDDFDRTNTSSDLGSDWENDSIWRITSNTAELTGTGSSPVARCTTTMGQPDNWVEGDLSPTTATTYHVGICARVNGATSYYALTRTGATSTSRVRLIRGGSASFAGHTAITSEFTPTADYRSSDYVRARLEIQGDDLAGYLWNFTNSEWDLVLTVTDSTYAAGNQVGIGANRLTGGNRVDNFRAGI